MHRNDNPSPLIVHIAEVVSEKQGAEGDSIQLASKQKDAWKTVQQLILSKHSCVTQSDEYQSRSNNHNAGMQKCDLKNTIIMLYLRWSQLINGWFNVSSLLSFEGLYTALPNQLLYL